MRIVQATGLISLKYGGLERSFVRLAQEGRARGHHLTFIWERMPTNAEFVRDVEQAGGVNVVIPARGRPLGFAVDMWRWLRNNPTDVMHGHFNPVALLALAAAAAARVPVRVSTLHAGFSPAELAGVGLRNRITVRARNVLSHRAIAISRAMRDQFVDLGLDPGKTIVCYLGIDPAPNSNSRDRVRAEFGISVDAPVIVCIAFHDPIKGVDVLLRSVALMKPVVPGLRLIQVGASLIPEQTTELKALGRELGIDDMVIWAGQRNDARDVLQAGDVYCQPSRSEGLALAILEAASAGLPSVASRVGGIPESVADGRTGVLVPPESPEALADTLVDMFENPERRSVMGEAGRSRVAAEFDLGRQTVELLRIYEALHEPGS